MINESAADLIYRFRTTMASSDADDAQADLAETLRTAAKHLHDTNPDRGADFSAGVDWAIEELRVLADDIANYTAGDAR
jgi:hypothetical protein